MEKETDRLEGLEVREEEEKLPKEEAERIIRNEAERDS